MVGDLMPTFEDGLYGGRVLLHAPGGEEKGLPHAELRVQIDQAWYRNLGPVAQHGQRRHARVGGRMIGQVQNTVRVHIEGEGHGASCTVRPGNWVFDHRSRPRWWKVALGIGAVREPPPPEWRDPA